MKQWLRWLLRFCMDCGIKLDKSYNRGDVCQKCFEEFNGATIKELIDNSKETNMSYRELIGKTEEEARKFCEENKFKFRIVKKDGQNFLGTCDYCLDRVNVEIKDGIVTGARLG